MALTDHQVKLALKAAEKQQRGQSLTVRESQALERYQKDRDRKKLKGWLSKIPMEEWFDRCGTTDHKARQQIKKHGLPLPTRKREAFDLGELASWLHRFLEEHEARLSADLEEDNRMDVLWLEELRKESAKLTRLKRLEQEEKLLPVAEVVDVFLRHAMILNKASVQLGRQYGPEAQAIMNDAIEDAERMMRQEFAVDRDPEENPTP